MASVLALISKAVFDKLGKLAVGDRPRMDRYLSAAKGLATLGEGGSLVLVTVRPGERLWLCAILDAPVFETTMWRAPPSEIPLADVTDLLPSVKLASGKGIQAPDGKLGMSLQTPRTLTEEDVALFRGAAPGASAKPARAANVEGPRKPPEKRAGNAAILEATKEPANEVPPPPRVLPTVTASGADVEALFAAVAASPDDVAVRQVLADRLLEAGDPLGEYIQLSCEVATLPEGDPRRATASARANDLQAQRSLAFSRRLRAIPFFNESCEYSSWPRFDFDRGFPDHVRGDARDLLPVLAAAAKVSPIRGLDLHEARAFDVRALAEMPELGRVRSLTIRTHESFKEALVVLFDSPHLERLDRLTLACPLTPDDMAALERCPALAGLVELSLAPTTAKGASATALLRGERCAGLRRLHLTSAAVDADAITGLAELEHLHLDSVTLGAAGAARLAEASPRRLRELTLGSCELGPKGLATWVASPALAGLESLSLSGMVTGKHLAALIDALALPALRKLGLNGSALRADGAAKLAAAAKKLALLTELSLRGAAIKDDGARALSLARFPNLTALDLTANGIAGPGMEALGSGPLLDTVRDLSIRNNKCQNEGGLGLAKAKGLRKLRKLSLFYNWMGVKAVRALLAAAPDLEELHADENNYGAAPSMFIAASTEMKRLRVLRFNEAEVGPLARSSAAQTVERLSVGASPIDSDAARALAALPRLDRLDLSFPTLEGDARAILRARFGPNLSVYPSGRGDGGKLPGPP